MVKIENNQVFSTEGKLIHRVGTNIYFKRGAILNPDSITDYEEVDEEPAYTKEEYDNKVAELVRSKYSESEEFAIQRKAINAAFSPSTVSAKNALSEYSMYNEFVEECKQSAKNPLLYKNEEE